MSVPSTNTFAPRNEAEFLPESNSYRITLTKGYSTLVSAEDFPRVAQHRWGVSLIKGVPYASRGAMTPKGQRIEYLHRFILRPQLGQHVDHASHETLDNRRTNIRIATPSQNQANRSTRKTSRGGYTGVQPAPGSSRYMAMLCGEYLGSYMTAEEAAKARDIAALDRFGAFAATNFPANELAVKPERTLPAQKTSIFTGVRRGHQGTWYAYVKNNGGRQHLGTFRSEVDAAIARDGAAMEQGKPSVNILPGYKFTMPAEAVLAKAA